MQNLTQNLFPTVIKPAVLFPFARFLAVHAALFGVLALFQLAEATPIKAAELVMLEQKGCAWCKRWHAEIGPAYPNTAEGKTAPLRIVDIDEPWPRDLAGIRTERFTPTFVLLDNGVEIARLRGYTGDEFFWFLLGEMLDKLPTSNKS
jgi:thioredoxin-related protein